MSDVRHILRRHGIRHCLVGGHSYGSIWAGWIIRALRKEVKQAVLLDPVRAQADGRMPFLVLDRFDLKKSNHTRASDESYIRT